MSAISFLLAALRITKPDGYLAYLVASLFPLLVSLLAFLLGNVLDSASVIMLYLLAVFLCALWLGKWPSVLAAVLSALMFNVLFVPPPPLYDTIILSYRIIVNDYFQRTL